MKFAKGADIVLNIILPLFLHYSEYTRTDQYAQRGEDAPMIAFGGQEEPELPE